MAGFRACQQAIDGFLSLFFPVFEAYFLHYLFYSFFFFVVVVVVQSFNLDVYFYFFGFLPFLII